jgi:hypothetical protein
MAEDTQYPFADTDTARFIAAEVHRLRFLKSQRAIAMEAEFRSPNIISAFKRGETKVPLERIPKLAAALEADPIHLFRLAIADYLPDLADAFERAFGYAITDNERSILLAPWQVAARQRDPAPTPAIHAAVKRMLDEVVTELRREERSDE